MKILLALTALLCTLGLLFVFDSSTLEGLNTVGNQYHFLQRQAIGMGIGAGALFVALLTPTQVWKKIAPLAYLGSLVLLLLVFVPGIGREFNGAHRWISVFGLTIIQPIEVAKLGLVLGLSYWLAKHQRLAPFLLVSCLPMGLVMLQPDLGSTLLLITLAGGLYFLAGGKLKLLAILGTITLAGVVFAIASSSYRTERFLTFINPSRDPLGSSFQIRQITLALGRGGLIGEGIGNSRQKVAFIPEPSTDSIFAIAAEETGFFGAAAIISLYLGYLATGWKIANAQKDRFRFLLGSGIVLWIGSQTLLNLAAVAALIPLTGMPLPFFSYGSSSLVMVLFATGILARLDINTKKQHR